MVLLFSRGDLSSYLSSQFSKLNYDISLLSLERAEDILDDGENIANNKELAQFIRDYEIVVPKLTPEGSLSREKIKHDVTRTRFSAEISFVGDPNLFMLRPTRHYFDPPSAIVFDPPTTAKEGVIVLQFDTINSNIDNVYQTFKDAYEKIRNYLTWIEQDVKAYHHELLKEAYKGIKIRYEGLCRNKNTPDRGGLEL